MIYCNRGNCPVDDTISICCLHCKKRTECEDACEQKNLSCSFEIQKNIKKELQK